MKKSQVFRILAFIIISHLVSGVVHAENLKKDLESKKNHQYESGREIALVCGGTKALLTCGRNEANPDTYIDIRLCDKNTLTFRNGKKASLPINNPEDLTEDWTPESLACTQSKNGSFYIIVKYSTTVTDSSCGAQCHIWKFFDPEGNIAYEGEKVRTAYKELETRVPYLNLNDY